ncbi:MAG: DUF4397 domain-containing protein [Chitinophagaceae bacterium]|nr:DUF4397 domain-containing protein [Chitinophagaceae bacterium]
MRYYHYCFFSLLFGLVLASSCKKVKEDVFFDRKDILNNPSSTIRIYNFTNGLLNISVNNLQLTSFVAAKDVNAPPTTGTQLGLSFFPRGVWPSKDDGSPITLPSALLDKNNRARIYIVPGYDKDNQDAIVPGLQVDTVLQDDPLHPKDYFLLSNGHFLSIPRSAVVPAAPDHFKLRVLNFGDAHDTLDLGGAVTVTYADGRPVSQALTDVQTGAASDYAEVPYGTYQFKLFVNNNHQKQLCELPITPFFDVCQGGIKPQSKISPIIKTFKPGGTYSIIVTKNSFLYGGCGPEDKVYLNINSYRIVAENSPPLNISYARLMGVNALTGESVVFKLDGQNMGEAQLASGKSTDASIVITGTHTISAYNAAGTLLVEKKYRFSAADYTTAWVYKKDGKPELVFTSNNMAISHYVSLPGDDGTNGSQNIATFDYAWQGRFLNLSNDVPYATFTSQDGENFINLQSWGDTLNPPASYQNLERGKPIEHEPFVIILCSNYNGSKTPQDAALFGSMPSLIRVFQSSPGPLGQTPGDWLSAVTPLASQDFIANRALYETGLPQTEAGTYSIALIGSLNSSDDQQKARLIFVKHNR